MTLKLKYKGRSFSSPRSMMRSVQRDLQNNIERKVRQVASSSGLSTTKTSQGLELKGTADQMERFHRRLGK